MVEWATHYGEIPDALESNDAVQSHALELISEEPIIGKSLQGGSREGDFREILSEFLCGPLDHNAAEQRISRELPPHESPHSGNNRVFHKQWADRLLRSQASRFYNQSVMEILQEREETECFVPHSPREDHDSDCTLRLAGGTHSVSELLNFLYSQQRHGNWDDGVTIPGHANCTHTVVPAHIKDEI